MKVGDSLKLNIKRILKKLTKANFTSLIFAVVSIISTTFAWFAYSNIVDNDMEISVKSWKIDISEGESMITNKLEIDLDEFYPGMETVYKKFTISNGGDIPSMVSYKVNSLRIYDQEFDVSDQYVIFDNLAQTYPFSLNFNLNKRYLGVGDEVEFTYSISWPLDSGDDIEDGLWGNRAYKFTVAEQNKKKQNSSYQIRDSISLEVELIVEQYVENDDVYILDKNYKFGTQLYLNDEYKICEGNLSDCKKYYVIDMNSSIEEEDVYVLSDPNTDLSYVEPTEYHSINKSYSLDSLLGIISSDVIGTQIVIPGISNRILGVGDDGALYHFIFEKLLEKNGYIIFSQEKFPMFDTDSCFWISNSGSYGSHNFAVKSLNDNTLQLYVETENACKILDGYFFSK